MQSPPGAAAAAQSTTPANGQLTHLWEPLDIGPTRVRNRVMYTAQTILYGEEHLLSDRHIAFYTERAKGGVGLMITEQQAGHPIWKGSFYPGCTAHDRRAVPQYAKLAEAVHEQGGRQFVQLFGSGVHDKGTMIYDEWHPLWAASRVTSIVHREVPMVMGQNEMDSTVQAFGESALNVKAAGLDGVEIHAAHSYLLGQFLSPAYNKRDDRYGGSIENRCRLIREIAESVRGQVGGEMTVGVRLSYDEFIGDAGLTGDEAQEIVSYLADCDLFDYFSISCGGYHTLFRTVSPMQVPEGFLEEAGRTVKGIVGDRGVVFLVGRIADVATAERLVGEGATDMAAMTRAQLADPFLVKKAQEGRTEDIVKCVGANICLAHAFDQKRVPCMMNPATGREAKLGDGTLRLVDPREAKTVVVVGGGPAGMRLGGTAAARGHKVILHEAGTDLGGHLNLLRQLPTRAGWEDAISNLRRPLEKYEVDVRLGSEVDVAAIAGLEADLVVCATGSFYATQGIPSPYRPERDAIPGCESANVLDLGSAVRLALADGGALGSRVLIYDELGHYLPLGLAELLTDVGSTVEIVTPHSAVGEEAIRTQDWFWIGPRLLDAGVTLTTQRTIEAIEPGRLSLTGVFGGPLVEREFDTVVLSLPRLPHDELHAELRGAYDGAVMLVGDALAPRSIEAVIYEAETTAREI
ncbi:MAG: FAD-dependent oxidoreductase [Actinobacteria bacterium]|nr:FAD-dependent oxidoreductase [Actinomycetota bacterium]